MKNLTLALRSRYGQSTLTICVATVLALLISTSRADAQQGKYVEQSATNLVKLINAANADGYKLRDNSFSIGGGWLKQSTSEWIKTYTIPLKAGTQYRFLAAGDNDAKDVDIEVSDANGKVVAIDGKPDPAAVASFTPKEDGKYLVKIRLYASRENVPCVCTTIVMAKTSGGSGAQGKYVAQSSANLVKLINAANGDGFKLRDNSLSIGGGWLKQSTSDWVKIYSVPLKAGTQYRFLAAGDNDAKDVDIEVSDATGKVVAVDGKLDPTATVTFTPKANGMYSVRIRLYASDSNLPCVCTAIVMTKK
jgi:hypothetical protein